MYKSIQMKLQSKEHIFLTKYDSGKVVVPFHIKMIYSNSMGPYAATYWKYYFFIDQPTPIWCNLHR